MDVATILETLRLRGITLSASGDDLVVDHHGEISNSRIEVFP